MGNGFDGSSSHISKYTNGRVKATGEKSGRNRLPQQEPSPPTCQLGVAEAESLDFSPACTIQDLRAVVIVALY